MRCLKPLLVALVITPALGCDSDVASPQPVSAQELSGPASQQSAYGDMTERELLITLLQRVDALESRVEREGKAAQAKLEALVAAGAAEGGIMLAARPVEKERSRGTEQCLELTVGSEAEIKQVISLLGNAFAGVGAWAGTGGSANVKGEAEAKAILQPLKGEFALKKSWCFGRGASRERDGVLALTDGSGVQMAAAAPDGLELEIAAVVDQLGLTEARASQALNHFSSMAAGMPSCRPGDCAPALIAALPISPDLKRALNDPQSFFRERAPDIGDFALDQLCADLFAGPFGTRLSQACDLVDRVPDTQGLFNAYERFDGIPDLVDRLNSRLSAVCGRTRGLIDGINGFRIDRHGIFQTDLLWPGPGVSQLGTDCRVLGSD